MTSFMNGPFFDLPHYRETFWRETGLNCTNTTINEFNQLQTIWRWQVRSALNVSRTESDFSIT